MNEEEKKVNSRKRTGIILLTFVAVICFFAAFAWWLFPKSSAVGTSGIYTKEALEEKALQVVSLLDQNDFDSLRADATEEMQSVLTQAQIDQIRDQLSDNWGERISVEVYSVQEVKQQGKLYAAAQALAAYENITVLYTISFDQEMRLAGIYMK